MNGTKTLMALTPDWYDWVHFDEAQFIVVGTDHMNGYGVIATTKDEFTAYRIKKYVNDNGGSCSVKPYNDEEMNENYERIKNLKGWD